MNNVEDENDALLCFAAFVSNSRRKQYVERRKRLLFAFDFICRVFCIYMIASTGRQRNPSGSCCRFWASFGTA